MDRRAFILVMGGSMVAALAAERAAARIPKIGYLSTSDGTEPIDIRFLQALRDLGWIEGQNVAIEARYIAGKPEQFAEAAAALVRADVDVIAVWSPPGVAAVSKATDKIPIVGLSMADPITAGWVKSYARPGGQVTGVSFAFWEITGKWFEFLKQIVPGVNRVAVLVNPLHPSIRDYLRETDRAARALKLDVKLFEVRSPDTFDSVFKEMTRWRPGALAVLPHPLFYTHRAQIVGLATTHHWPGAYWSKEFAELGGLFAYAPSLVDMAGRGAVYVDKILKGTKPADLPVEQPTKYELVINLKTAKALGLTISQTLLLRADQVVE
jgi:putative ABC transport system substrate-binding protein